MRPTCCWQPTVVVGPRMASGGLCAVRSARGPGSELAVGGDFAKDSPGDVGDGRSAGIGENDLVTRVVRGPLLLAFQPVA
jgi:hypothetical protein